MRSAHTLPELGVRSFSREEREDKDADSKKEGF